MTMHRRGHVLVIPRNNPFFSIEPNKKVRIVSIDTLNKIYEMEVLEGKDEQWEAPMRYIDNNFKRIKEE